MTVICNPNNPDGRLIPVADLRSFVEAQTGAGVTTVVDEAFADLHPDASLIPQIGSLDAVVLRLFGKFYGLAGLRLGFAVGPPERIHRLRAQLGDWPVSSPAIRIGCTALADRAWQDQTRSRLAQDATRLRGLLDRRGFEVAGGTDLFVLIRDDHADAVHRELAYRGIWTRVFDHRDDWLRIGLPPDAAGASRLDTALAVIRSPRGK
ncbi:MAG: aminotransferase class I/II-fold pyridoxal phosphate-dependent enzyme [Hyphomicrobiales bacterium]|nr:aminotransferase class I/II-fold pyridoxal phosphate-dependent enzyme [Hyphomicrobiales bacterium]